jgi:hypothetical protein
MNPEFSIEREIELPATPEQVWEAITTRQGLASWLWDQELPAEPPPAVRDAPHRLRIELPAAPGGATQAFEYVIEARDGGLGALLRFVHSGFLGDDWEGDVDFESLTGSGWDMYLHTLREYLTHFRGRPVTYINAEAPQSTAEPSAWAALLTRLGLDGATAAGDRVSLGLDGLAPIEGVADYVGPTFLGIRSDDALYRFHGRAAFHCPIAIGHHLFADGVDPETTREAWRSWLSGVHA